MNTVEFHTWNSTIKRSDKPDRVIFDLDPGEAIRRQGRRMRKPRRLRRPPTALARGRRLLNYAAGPT
jgi:hypothetical protein